MTRSFVFLSIFISLALPYPAKANWNDTGASEPINPLRCEYRVLQPETVSNDTLNYSIYSGKNFTVKVDKKVRSTTSELKFEIEQGELGSLAGLIVAEERENYNTLRRLQYFGCDLTLSVEDWPKRNGLAKQNRTYTLFCSGGSDEGGDFAGFFQIIPKRVQLQSDCR